MMTVIVHVTAATVAIYVYQVKCVIDSQRIFLKVDSDNDDDDADDNILGQHDGVYFLSVLYGLRGGNAPWFICWFWSYVNYLFLY